VKGHGNSTTHTDYDFDDMKPLRGVSYYRLRQTDFDGQSETFKVVPVSFDSKQTGLQLLNVAPNPFQDDFTVSYTSDRQLQATVAIYSSAGKLFMEEKTDVVQGTNSWRFENQINLPPGVYVLAIQCEGEKPVTAKVIKR
jgi:hypothetical protein